MKIIMQCQFQFQYCHINCNTNFIQKMLKIIIFISGLKFGHHYILMKIIIHSKTRFIVFLCVCVEIESYHWDGHQRRSWVEGGPKRACS